MNPLVEVRFTPEFKRSVRALAKKYRHIRFVLITIYSKTEQGDISAAQPRRIVQAYESR